MGGIRLEKLQIYPYQRLSQPVAGNEVPSRRKLKNRSFKIDLSSLFPEKGKLLIILKELVTLEHAVLAAGACIMARAFVLGELLPFVFAYLIAFGRRNTRQAVIIAAFAIAGLLTLNSGYNLWSNILTLLALLVVMTYIKIPEEKYWWGLPVLAMALVFVAKSIFLLLNGLTFYREMIIVFEALISGIMAFVFLVASDTLYHKKALVDFNFEDRTAFVILGIGIIMGLNDVYFAGLGISSILSKLGILLAAYLWGSSGGTMVGVMVGIIPSITSSIFAQSLAMYAVAGLIAGLFSNFGRLGIIIGFLLGNLGLSMFLSETQAAILGIWETGVAAMAFFLLPASLKEKLAVHSLGTLSNLKAGEVQVINSQIEANARNRMENFARVFEELSSTFMDKKIHAPNTSPNNYLNYLYDEISNVFCRSCSYYERCWEKDCYHTSQEILDVFALAEVEGELNYDDCPMAFRKRCTQGREMVNTINALFNNLRINEYWSEKFTQSRDLVSLQLQGVSQVMKSLVDEIELKTTVDVDLRELLLKQSKKRGLNLKEVTPLRTGGQQLYLRIVCDSCIDRRKCETHIAPVISALMLDQMEVNEKKCPLIMGKGPCEFVLTRAFTYRITSGAAQVGKEDICGDSFTIATLREGKELVALSDGMGVGETACNDSQAAVRLLENLLNTGFNKETALKTINSVLLLRSKPETFATLDMVMIDLYSADADFIKVGSAPSFIKRGKTLEVINSNTLPIGILDNIDLVSEKRSLSHRDMIIMVSDGVLEISRNGHGELWISQLLTGLEESNPQTVAELIINKALSLCKGRPHDDMTVICVNIEYNYPQAMAGVT